MQQKPFLKLLALFLFASFFFAAGCASLRGSAGSPSEIVVNTPYSAQKAFNRAGRELSERGYNFEEINRQFGSLRTNRHRLNDSVRVQIAVDVFSVSPGEVRFWGWYRTEEGTFRIHQAEEPGTAAYDAWQELKNIAEWMPGSVSYR